MGSESMMVLWEWGVSAQCDGMTDTAPENGAGTRVEVPGPGRGCG